MKGRRAPHGPTPPQKRLLNRPNRPPLRPRAHEGPKRSSRGRRPLLVASSRARGRLARSVAAERDDVAVRCYHEGMALDERALFTDKLRRHQRPHTRPSRSGSFLGHRQLTCAQTPYPTVTRVAVATTTMPRRLQMRSGRVPLDVDRVLRLIDETLAGKTGDASTTRGHEPSASTAVASS